MKEQFIVPVFEVVRFGSSDVICASTPKPAKPDGILVEGEELL